MHLAYNRRLASQGLPVDEIESKNTKVTERFRQYLPKTFTLAMTAACEHLTATLSHGLFDHPEHFVGADPRVMAMYTWHGAEEMEHKSVAITILRDVAKVGYLKRVAAFCLILPMFFLHTFLITYRLLSADGFTFRKKMSIWRKGLGWFFSPKGFFASLLPHYLAYYRRDFDPWKVGEMHRYQQWLEAYDRTGDVLQAAAVISGGGSSTQSKSQADTRYRQVSPA